MIAEKIKKRKLLMVLLIIMVVSFICGLLFVSILSDANKDLIKTSINDYFTAISDNKINYLKGLYTSMSNNLILNIILWVMGISIIGVLVAILILIIKSFLVAFSFVSIIFTYGFKGVLVGTIYILPEIMEVFVTFVVAYYSISFSIILFNYLFRKKEYNKKVIVERYLKLLILSIGILVVISLISVFVIPFVLRMF